jgi:hypothetical protein
LRELFWARQAQLRKNEAQNGACHTSAYVSIRQHTSAYVSIRQQTPADVNIRQQTPADASILFFFSRKGLPDVQEVSIASLFKMIAIAVEQVSFSWCGASVLFLTKAYRMWRRCPLRVYSK